MAVSRVVPNHVAGVAAIQSFHYSITALHHDPCFTAPLMLCYIQFARYYLPTHAQHFPPELDSLRNQEATHALRSWRVAYGILPLHHAFSIAIILSFFLLFRPVPHRAVAPEEVQQKDKHSNRLYHHYTIT
jgi:hypothetical protein